jgi:hypothetical protein
LSNDGRLRTGGAYLNKTRSINKSYDETKDPIIDDNLQQQERKIVKVSTWLPLKNPRMKRKRVGSCVEKETKEENSGKQDGGKKKRVPRRFFKPRKQKLLQGWIFFNPRP